MTIDRLLDVLLESGPTPFEQGAAGDDPYQNAVRIAGDLEEARRTVSDLERQLIWATDRLCGNLAVGVRRHRPGLHVGLGGGSCKVGYKSRSLALRPDVTKKVWVVDGPDRSFVSRFMRGHGPRTALVPTVDEVARSVADYFSGFYKTLGEGIVGTGVILVDGRRTTTQALVEYADGLGARGLVTA